MKNIKFLGFIILILYTGCFNQTKEQSVIIQSEYDSLNQVELMKQWLGNWKIELSSDTIVMGEGRPYGNKGLEGEYQILANGKVIKEVKMLYGFEKSKDKIIETGLIKEGEMEIFALWFTSPTEYTRISYNDISMPENASSYMLGEMISKDTILETWYLDDNPTYSHMWIKVP